MSERQDPWSDLPSWSTEPDAGHEEAAPSHGEQASGGELAPAEGGPARQPANCPWCAAPVAPGAARCSSCGAAVTQRESIGDLVVPGLTAVDPALADLDGRPMRLRGPSPSQGLASSVVAAAVAGGPVGLTVLGGIAAVAAAEYLGASGGARSTSAGQVGEPSEAVRRAVERLDRGDARSETGADAPAAGAQSPDPDHDEEARHGSD